MKQARRKCNVNVRAGVQTATALILVATSSLAMANGPRDQAKKIHDRLVGVPPTEAVLSTMAAQVAAGDAVSAANEAMKNPIFYNTTLKNFVTPWTNAEQTPYAELNDYTATVIGMIRDNVPFNQVLTGDILYTATDTTAVPDAYSTVDNKHYQDIEKNKLNMGDPLKFSASVPQSSLNGIAPENVAGILTTRAFGEAFIKAGTNRRAFRFTSINYLCRDLEDLHDVTRPPDRIRQDVSRSPGGDSAIFLNQCIGCHSGMDPMTQAFAYYDFGEKVAKSGLLEILVTPGQVQPKNLINSNNFPMGYIVKDDHWDNYWRHGQNASLGWDPNKPGSGTGIKSFGDEIVSSQAFAQCQVQKVFKFTCLRDPNTEADKGEVQRISGVFKQGYNMKQVFAEVAAYCKGD
jgi:hypothetical protein